MATTYLSDTQATPTNNKKWTWSSWCKFSATGEQYIMSAYTDANNNTSIRFLDDTNRLDFQNYVSSGDAGRLKTTRYLRDPAAWYHIVCIFDSDNASSGDRQQIWINGVRETAFDTETYPSSGAASILNASGIVAEVGRRSDNANMLNGVLAHTHFCDGYAYDASYFGETDSTSGIWVAKTSPSVSYGTNGFFLKYASGASGTDSSGNGNNFTVSGTLTQTKDTPDDNFCTINPLSAGAINGAGTPLTNGNTRIADGDTNWRTSLGTIGDDQGKYYWEVKIDGSQTNWWLGILDARQVVKGEYKLTTKSRGYGVTSNGDKGNNNSEVSWATATIAQNDIVSIALDMDNGKIYFGHNGTWLESGDPTSGSTGTGSAYDITTGCCYLPAFTVYDTNSILAANMGNGYFGTTAVSSAGTNASGIGTFEYDVPTGYTAVSTLGLME